MKKFTSKILATLIAVALMLTSGVGVFAASGSPTKGPTIDSAAGVQNGYAAASENAISATWQPQENAAKYIVYVNGVAVAEVTDTQVVLAANKGVYFDVVVQAVDAQGNKGAQTLIGHVTTQAKAKKIKAKKAGKKSIKVSWKKVKGVSGYIITVYKDGVFVKTVRVGKKATSKTIKKLGKGKYKFVVTPVYNNAYLAEMGSTKTVKLK